MHHAPQPSGTAVWWMLSSSGTGYHQVLKSRRSLFICRTISVSFSRLKGERQVRPISVVGWRVTAHFGRASLFPSAPPGAERVGFELCLTSDEPPPSPPEARPATAHAAPGLVGRDVAPVLRQPIARIIANAETIRTRLAGPLSEEYSNYAADISAAGQHLLALLDDLSDLEVVESDDFRTAPRPHRPCRCRPPRRRHPQRACAGTRDPDRHAAGRRDPAGDCRVSPGSPGPAQPDRQRHSLFARQFAGLDQAGGWKVAGRRRPSPIRGQGISLDDQQRMFEKFERLGRSGDGGSGLGPVHLAAPRARHGRRRHRRKRAGTRGALRPRPARRLARAPLYLSSSTGTNRPRPQPAPRCGLPPTLSST